MKHLSLWPKSFDSFDDLEELSNQVETSPFDRGLLLLLALGLDYLFDLFRTQGRSRRVDQ